MHGVVVDAAGGAASQAEQAASLFLRDATHVVRWHAVAAGVALAATPVVYQVVRFVARSHRAELVHLAKDAVQREELFNGAEADGVLIDPAEEGGISVTYTSSSSRAASPGDGGSGVKTTASPPADPQQQQQADGPPSSPFTFRVGRQHSRSLASFAHEVLAAQRAPNVQFVRTCSWAAARQYSAVVLRTAAVSCSLSLASLGVLCLGCRAFDHVVRFGDAAGAPPSPPVPLLRSLFTAPLFTTAAPPEPAVGCTYGLYDFSVSAAGVWSRLLPRCGALQTVWQQLTGRVQPLHLEWRGAADGSAGSVPSSSPHARADKVWAALSPRGFFVVALLPRLPARLLTLLHWLVRRGTTAAMRRWYAARPPSPAHGPASPAPALSTPQSANASTSLNSASSALAGGRGIQPAPSPPPSASAPPQHASPATSARQPGGQALPRRRAPRRLFSSPLARAAAMVASDLAFAGIVFVATSCAPSGPRGGGGDGSPRWPFVVNDANDRYDFFCWAEAVCSVCSFVSL